MTKKKLRIRQSLKIFRISFSESVLSLYKLIIIKLYTIINYRFNVVFVMGCGIFDASCGSQMQIPCRCSGTFTIFVSVCLACFFQTKLMRTVVKI